MTGGARQGGRRSGTGRWAAVAATLLALPAGYLAVRTAVAELQSPAVAALPPSDYRPLLRPLLMLASDPRQRITGEMAELARDGAKRAPLAYEPFAIAAATARQQGQIDDAIRLLEEARRRQPNSVLVRLQLMAAYEKARRFPELLSEMDYTLRMSDEVRQVVLPELAKLIRDADGRAALAAVVSEDRAWRGDFFAAAARLDLRPEHTGDLLRRIQARRSDVGLERGLHMQALIAARDYSGAREQWLAMLPPAGRAASALLFDGGFRGHDAPPPFAWQLRDDEVGRSERVQPNGAPPYLDVHYFGGRTVPLAEQLLALPPGRYRLSVHGMSDGGVRVGSLIWHVSCAPGGATLGQLKLNELTPSYARHQMSFVVPVGCAGQDLRLIGEAGDVAATIDARFANLEVAREN
ncbi:MAG: tetratricopeptide repeat protein [Allosphingosinicella sp.]|uniref:tetratricopeptide repeat protein n=1 Tax=Allosphingosinicella sp. TaxID=2823234 RepID=UPI00392731BA